MSSYLVFCIIQWLFLKKFISFTWWDLTAWANICTFFSNDCLRPREEHSSCRNKELAIVLDSDSKTHMLHCLKEWASRRKIFYLSCKAPYLCAMCNVMEGAWKIVKTDRGGFRCARVMTLPASTVDPGPSTRQKSSYHIHCWMNEWIVPVPIRAAWRSRMLSDKHLVVWSMEYCAAGTWTWTRQNKTAG